MIVDLFLVYQFLRRLTTPFKDWEAYKLGIIDERGNVLKKRRNLNLKAERDAFGVFDLMVLNIKKLIEKLPGGQTRIASYAAALFLIREHNMFLKDSEQINLNENRVILITEQIGYFLQEGQAYYTTIFESVKQKKSMEEEIPTNSVSSGNFAGLGFGPQGEPVFRRKDIMKMHRRRMAMDKIRNVVLEKKKCK